MLQTGDTAMAIDHGNIIAYRNALLISDGHDRSTPPLASYLTAASFSLLGVSSFSARLPFALLGLGTVALMLFWVRDEKWPVLWTLAAGLVGNVSLILFFRQCRYYGPAIFFSVAIAFVYWRWKPSPRNLLLLSLLSALLFVGDYMNYLALYVCLGADWLVWRRKEWNPGWFGWLCFFGPQVILNGIACSIWNPLKTHFGNYESLNTLGDRLTLFYWYWRDMDRSECLVLPVILVALVVGIVQGRAWLIRGCVALVIYIAALSAFSPSDHQGGGGRRSALPRAAHSARPGPANWSALHALRTAQATSRCPRSSSPVEPISSIIGRLPPGECCTPGNCGPLFSAISAS